MTERFASLRGVSLITAMFPRLLFFLAISGLLLGCHHREVPLVMAVDDLVYRKATKTDAAHEFGSPVRSSVDGNRETLVFIPTVKSSRKTITKTVNGVETREETVVSTPGKLQVTMIFLSGVAVGGTVAPAH